MINVQLMNDEVYVNCQNYSEDIYNKIQEHPDSADWIFGFANNQPFEPTEFSIEDFQVFLPLNKDDKESIVKTAISMHKALKELPGHIIGDVRFWAWLAFSKMYKFINCLEVLTKENLVSMIVPKAVAIRRATMQHIVGRFYFMCDLCFSEDKEDPYYLVSYLVTRGEIYRSLAHRNISDIPALSKAVIIAAQQFENEHNDLYVSTEIVRRWMKEITAIGSVRLIDAIPEEELTNMVKERLQQTCFGS